MTLFEKIKEVYNLTSDFKKFAKIECVIDCDLLENHYDCDALETICGSWDGQHGKCLRCWNLEYIENENADAVQDVIEDNINHPTHYQGKHECIDIMRVMFGDEAVKGFCKCNAFKYRFRAGKKEGNSAEQDISKAEWYEEYLFEMEKEDKHD